MLQKSYCKSVKVKYILLNFLILFNANTLCITIVHSNTPLVPFFSVSFKNLTTGYITGVNGIILMTTNGGINWVEQSRITDKNLGKIIFMNDSIGYITGALGTILKTTDGGLQWFQLNSGTSLHLSGISFVNSGTGFVCGGAFFSPVILKTIDGGLNWQSQPVDSLYDLSDISFIDENTGVVVGNRTILRTTNGGINWFRNPISYMYYLNEVEFIDSNLVFIAGSYNSFGSGSGILRSNNGGESWEGLCNTCNELYGMQFVNPNYGTTAGDYGKIYRTSNGGNNWINQSLVFNSQMYLSDVFFIDENNGWVVGRDSGYGLILHTTNGGNNWSIMSEKPFIPSSFSFSQNYPNPFNSTTAIKYNMSRNGRVTITIYNALGQLVTILLDEYKEPGSHIVEFNGTDFASGVYFYQFKITNVTPVLITDPVFAPLFTETKKFVLIK